MTACTQSKEKEDRILDSLNRLLASGKCLSEITASDIANAAGIAKGTLYLYFSSKEEIIRRAILRSLNTELRAIGEQIAEKDTFEEKLKVVLNCIENIALNENSNFHILLFHIGSKEVKRLFGEECAQMYPLYQSLYAQIMDLIRYGCAEGTVKKTDEFYAYQAFGSAILGFFHLCMATVNFNAAKDGRIASAKENAYRIVLLSLQEQS